MQMRYKIVIRDQRCLRCGSEDELSIDHIKPVVLGGQTTLDNLQTLCVRCNSWKNDQEIDFRGQQPNTELQWDIVKAKREIQYDLAVAIDLAMQDTQEFKIQDVTRVLRKQLSWDEKNNLSSAYDRQLSLLRAQLAPHKAYA